jgi:3'(2'), 5'-bisphosphate nucleotidase
MENTNISLIAINAAIAAGHKILEVYNGEDLGIETKTDESPLTRADIAANDIIIERLKRTDIPFITEEIKAMSFEERKGWKQCWIIDPLDGTKEFINRNGEFTVNIALIENQRPVLGIIYVPVSKKLYYGNVSEGVAFTHKVDTAVSSLGKLMEDAEKLVPLKDSDIIRVVGSKSHMNDATRDFIESLKASESKGVEVVSMGSSLKFCMVASGEAHIYPRFAPTMEWDTAAGQAICEAVGLVVIDQETQRPMVYNRENLLNAHFLVK